MKKNETKIHSVTTNLNVDRVRVEFGSQFRTVNIQLHEEYVEIWFSGLKQWNKVTHTPKGPNNGHLFKIDTK